jgi:hypothetical protein
MASENRYFHRVQRVEKKLSKLAAMALPQTTSNLAPQIQDLHTRRINLTFRFVPPEHIKPLQDFPAHLKADLQPMVKELALYSDYFAAALDRSHSS